MEKIIYGNIRVELLSKDILRIEYGKNGSFCDENTFFIPNRTEYKEGVAYTQEENVICFGEYELYLPDGKKGLAGVRLEKNGRRVYTYSRAANSGELPAPDKTPEVFALSDTPRILLPEGGYSQDRTGEYRVIENVQDVYLLLCQKDAKKLRKLYVELTGKCELVRLSALGGWNSKYYAYSEETAKQLILDYEAHKFPLDVMVIDTDWRSCENGWGYDVNEKLFPDMERFLRFAHDHGVEIMFNDHPEPAEGTQVFAPEEIAYRESNLQSLMKKGVDIWWYDRNWGTHLISPTKQVYWETLGLYLFEDITRHYYQNLAANKEIYRRPVIMGNVVNITNGNYYAITDSASHRYSIQWTGDVGSRLDDLSQEVDNLLRCTTNCIPYVNSDCGGHTGNPDREEFVRWMQFGTLSPVFRPHCTKIVERTREPWVYDKEVANIVREYNNLRYRLLPVIYKNAYNAYETGEPMFKSLGFEYPEDKKACKRDDEYMLGNDLIISPVAGCNPVSIKSENYVLPVKATFYRGKGFSDEPIAQTEWKRLELNLHDVSPFKGVPVHDYSARFEITVKFEDERRLFLRADDNATVYVDGEKVFEDNGLHSVVLDTLCDLTPFEEHTVVVEYYHYSGDTICGLYAGKIYPDGKKRVYLPEGKWLDLFSGKIYLGGKTIVSNYALRETPLFVRLGAILPLAQEARNTGEQKWDRLVFDFYPCKETADGGYLYEDDTETTAYKLGQFRKSAYEAYYCEECHAYVVKLHASEGAFVGEKCFENRNITLKYHLFKGAESVQSVTVNGREVKYTKRSKNKTAFPLNAGDSAPDSDVISVSFDTEVNKEYEIRFNLQ